VLKALVLGCIASYRKAISPYLPTACRFVPTCSQYSQEAIHSHGLFKGTWLALRRLSRCQPLGGRGYDPVP
jgi:putative membrane protein insertion efficiency factor